MHKKIFTTLMTCLLLGSAAPVYAAQSAAAATSKQVQINIPAGTLIAALEKLGESTHLTLLYDRKLVEGKPNAAISGRMRVEDALRQLLKGSGIAWSFVNDDTIVLKARKAAPIAMVSKEESKAAAALPDDEGTVERMVVESEREKREPFSDANMDIPRTINDAQPYYIFDAKTIERSGATNIEDFLKQRLTMNTVAQTNGAMSGIPTGGNTSFPLGNTSTIDLRGVGADKTLILINGRRAANVVVGTEGFQSDLNGIPLSAIDRIEVLPSSASGIYGGSAIGGVVNVILKKSYSGAEVQATYGNTWGADSATRRVSLSYGTPIGKYGTQVNFNVSWSDAKPLLLRDRVAPFERNVATILRNAPTFLFSSESPWLGSVPNIVSGLYYVAVPEGTPDSFGPFPVESPYTTEYGVTAENNYLLYDEAAPLRLKDGRLLSSRVSHLSPGVSSATSAADLAAALLANSGEWNLDLPQTTQSPTGLLLPFGGTPEARSYKVGIRQQVMSRLELFADFSYDDNQSETIFNAGGGILSVSGAALSNPFAHTVYMTIPDAGRVPLNTRSQSRAATVGALAQLPWGWTGAFDYTWSESTYGYLYYLTDSSARNADLESGALNPFVDTLQYPLNFGKYQRTMFYDGSNQLSDLTLRAAGRLPALPWGTPTLAIGLEQRTTHTPENTDQVSFPITVRDSYLAKYYERDSITRSGYLEMMLPLVKPERFPLLHSLELQLSGRSERFEVDTGTSTRLSYINRTPVETYYGGTTLNDQPYFSQTNYASDNYTFGIKYKPLRDLTLRASPATAFLPPHPDQLIKDPLQSLYPMSVNDPKTGRRNVPVYTLSGGNPDLRPQRSKSRNVGVIWEPQWNALAGLRLNVEYYQIEQFDAISALGAQQIVNLESNYPGRVIRDSNGTITLVDKSLLNLFYRKTNGLDVSLDYSLNTGFGRFRLNVLESTIGTLKNQYAQTLPAYDAVGYHPVEGGAGKYKANGTLSWEWGDLTAAWSSRYFGSYKMYGAAGGPKSIQEYGGAAGTYYSTVQGSDTVPSQAYHDLFLGYTMNAGSKSRWLSLFSDMTAQLGVRNVFDKAPPMDIMFSNNYYLSPYGDAQQRSYWISVRKRL